jgi:hypothetical protein
MTSAFIVPDARHSLKGGCIHDGMARGENIRHVSSITMPPVRSSATAWTQAGHAGQL